MNELTVACSVDLYLGSSDSKHWAVTVKSLLYLRGGVLVCMSRPQAGHRHACEEKPGFVLRSLALILKFKGISLPLTVCLLACSTQIC